MDLISTLLRNRTHLLAGAMISAPAMPHRTRHARRYLAMAALVASPVAGCTASPEQPSGPPPGNRSFFAS